MTRNQSNNKQKIVKKYQVKKQQNEKFRKKRQLSVESVLREKENLLRREVLEKKQKVLRRNGSSKGLVAEE